MNEEDQREKERRVPQWMMMMVVRTKTGYGIESSLRNEGAKDE